MSNLSTAAGGLPLDALYRHAIVLVDDHLVLIAGNALGASLSGVSPSNSTGVTMRSSCGF